TRAAGPSASLRSPAGSPQWQLAAREPPLPHAAAAQQIDGHTLSELRAACSLPNPMSAQAASYRCRRAECHPTLGGGHTKRDRPASGVRRKALNTMTKFRNPITIGAQPPVEHVVATLMISAMTIGSRCRSSEQASTQERVIARRTSAFKHPGRSAAPRAPDSKWHKAGPFGAEARTGLWRGSRGPEEPGASTA